jgi:hypothetical protein
MARKDMPKGATIPGAQPSAMDMWSMFYAPQARMAEAVLAQNIEMLDFLKARFERDRAMLADLAKATDPTEVGKMWQDFFARMFTDYSTETTQLAAHAGELAETARRSATEEGAAMAAMAGPSKE